VYGFRPHSKDKEIADEKSKDRSSQREAKEDKGARGL